MISIIGMRWGGFDQCVPTTRSGCSRSSAIFVIGMPDVFEARSTLRPDVPLVLGEDLLLEVELLGHGLDHGVDAVERLGDVRRVATPSRRP